MTIKNALSFLLLGLFVHGIFFSCKPNPKEESDAEPTEKTVVETLITENEGEYPRDLDLFGDNQVNSRLKNIVGDQYASIKENFETQTPIVSEEGIYKFSGCKAHNCPSFLTKVYYDAKHDNFNLVVSQSGKVKVYEEKEGIKVPRALESK